MNRKEAAKKTYEEIYMGEPLTQEVPLDAFEKGAEWENERILALVEKWRARQHHYQDIAEKYRENEHNYKKFTYKALATRDCWKELLSLLDEQGKTVEEDE
jgi:hypothetical protein